MFMDKEVIKSIIEILTDEPISLVRQIIKTMRTIFLILISMTMYRFIIGNFNLVHNIDDLFTYFNNGTILKSLGIFLGTWIVFDVVLMLLINYLTSFYMDRVVIMAKKINKTFVNDKDNTIEQIRNNSDKIFIKISKFINLDDTDKKLIQPTINKVNINKYDNYTLIIFQFLIVSLISKVYNTWVFILLILAFIIVQLFKIIVVLNKNMYEKIDVY